MRETLAILVNSDAHPDYVARLARAAFEKGKRVAIHFFGRGAQLAEPARTAELKKVAEVSVCRDSFLELGGLFHVDAGLLEPPTRVVELIRDSRRYVVL